MKILRTQVKRKYNDRGQVIEELTTAVMGLIFISKITYEYDPDGFPTAEIIWKNPKHILAITPVAPPEWRVRK